MKRELKFTAICYLLAAVCHWAHAQNTAFTYQGQLNDGAGPANGSYDLQFTLFNTNQFGLPLAPVLTNAAVHANNGVFTTTLDFGSGVFTGTNLWIEISVRTNGGGEFTTLAPRQLITPAPYAITAGNLAGVVANNSIQNGASEATISGGTGNVVQAGANEATIGGGGNNSIGANSFLATISGGANNSIGASDDTSTISGGNQNIIQDGAGVSTISGGVGNQIQTGSPRSTISGGSNNQILTNAEHSFIGGGDGNQIRAGSHYSAIVGGSQIVIGTNAAYSAIVGGFANSLESPYSCIDGGYNNQIQSNANYSAIAGGLQNTIQNSASSCVIGGGSQNAIQTNAQVSFIGGGEFNAIQANCTGALVGGGIQNVIEANSSYSAIGGGDQNVIQTGAFKSVIAGGEANVIQSNSYYSSISGGYLNAIQTNASYSVIGGGAGNSIQMGTYSATIDGGNGNTIQTNAPYTFIGGGNGNMIQFFADYSTISGGNFNAIQTNSQYATISGGSLNTIYSNATAAAIGGGQGNNASGFAATVPGGYENVASGNYSFAAGRQAQALQQGTFVWADSQSVPFSSTASDQFLIRAQGGVGVNMNNPAGASLYVRGNRTGGWGSSVGVFENTSTASGSSPALRVVVDGGNAPDGALNVSDNGTGPIAEFGNGIGFVASVENDGTIKSKGVVLTSDRNAKENFTALDAKAVLEKVVGLPLSKWNYKDDSAEIKHIGPVAQDFHEAFGLNGPDDKHISIVDEGGVALAAIQGLNQKLRDELMRRDAENAELKQRLEALEKAIRNSKVN